MVNKKTNLEGYNNFIFKKLGKILQNLFQSGFVKILRKFVVNNLRYAHIDIIESNVILLYKFKI